MYNTLIESGIPVKLFGLITLCLSETCSKVRTCIVTVFIRNGLETKSCVVVKIPFGKSK